MSDIRDFFAGKLMLAVHLTFFLAPSAGAEDKPAAKPADARRATLVRAGYTPVALALDPNVLAFSVDGAVGREKVRYYIDSGATTVFLDLKLARRLKLKLGEPAAATGPDGPVVGWPTFVPGLKIGSFDTRNDWPDLLAVFSDMSRRPRSGCVLGVQALDAWTAVIDYPNRTLYLRSLLTTAWPRLAGTWKVTSWEEDGAARKFDPKGSPTFSFTDRRLRVSDGGKTNEYGIRFMPGRACDFLYLFDPKQEGKPEPVFIGCGRVKVKDEAMTACLCGKGISNTAGLKTPKFIPFPTKFAAPKGSGLVLLELKHTAPHARKPPGDPLRELLLKDGYTAVRLDRDPDGSSRRRAVARVGRHDLPLLVDTGATVSAFDAAGLRKWGAVRLGRTEAQGWGGKMKGEKVLLRGLTLGKYNTRRAWAVVDGVGIDLPGLMNNASAEQEWQPIRGYSATRSCSTVRR